MESRTNLFGLAVLVVSCLCGAAVAVEVLEPGYEVEEYCTYASAGVGSATSMTFDETGNLYVLHCASGSIWRITPERVANKLTDGLTLPAGITWTGGSAYGDNLYVGGDSGGIKRVALDGTKYSFSSLVAVYCGGLDRIGNYGGYLFAGTGGQDHIYQLATDGSATMFSNWPGWTNGGGPHGLEIDPAGNYGGLMYVTSWFGSENAHISGLFSMDTAGNASRFTEAVVAAHDLAFDTIGHFDYEMFVIGKSSFDGVYEPWRVSPDGTARRFAQSESMGCLTFGPEGALYVPGYDADTETVVISRISKADGLVAHWKFDEGEGSIAYDSAGSNDGTIYGATWGYGVLDGALKFDGVGDYVDCGDNDSLDVNDELTISAWMKRPDFSTPGTIAGKTNGNSVTAGYALFSHIEGLEFIFYSQGWKRTTPRVAVTANQWHHVAGTFNGNTAYLYVDGEQGASIAYNGAITAAAGYPVLIGYWRSQNTVYFNGQIDDVRIYDRALSAAEILALYEPYRPGVTYHIDGLNGSDGWDGLTAETAFETIQKGIDTAQDRDTVVVWPWVYVERINFEGKAITVTSVDYPAVIEAPWNDAVSFDSGEGAGSALSNFVVRDSGTAVACSSASRPTLKNLTIVDNDLGIAAYDGSEPNITNCILWNNIDGDLLGCEAEYSLAEQDVSDPTAEAPLFADFEGGDYHLLSENGRYVPAYGLWAFDDETSSCVDGGDPGEDPFGERMPNGGRINMGAYGGTVYASMSEWPLAHDENKDGRTDFMDFASLCDEWLVELPWAAPPGTPAADRRPPEPDPSTWDIEPYATSSSSILMAATAGADENGVEYYFENVTIGGHASGWQDSDNWTDLSLASSTKYCYRVKTRDKSPNANESGWSSTLCATTSSGGR